MLIRYGSRLRRGVLGSAVVLLFLVWWASRLSSCLSSRRASCWCVSFRGRLAFLRFVSSWGVSCAACLSCRLIEMLFALSSVLSVSARCVVVSSFPGCGVISATAWLFSFVSWGVVVLSCRVMYRLLDCVAGNWGVSCSSCLSRCIPCRLGVASGGEGVRLVSAGRCGVHSSRRRRCD